MKVSDFLIEKIRVLSLEDSSMYQEVIKNLLAEEFIEIDFCSSVGALSNLNPKSYDVLLVDLNVEDSVGIETFHLVKGYNVPIIVLTAYPNPDYADEALDKNSIDFLVKPINKANLLLKVIIAFYKKKRDKIPPEVFEKIKEYI